MKFPSLLIVPLLLVFLSCQDDDDSLNKTVVDRMIFHENVDQIREFEYNSDASIKRYNYIFDNVVQQYVDFIYGDKRLVSKNYYEKTGSGSFTLIRTDVFTYNADGTIKTMAQDSPQEGTYEFTWSNGRILRVDFIWSSFGETRHSFYEYEYDGKGNVITETSYSLVDEQPQFDYVVEFEYDDKANPLVDQAESNDVVGKSPNNVLRKIQRTSLEGDPFATVEVDITYNVDGLPVEYNITNDIDGDLSESTVKISYKKI